jgi:hypothetical protein
MGNTNKALLAEQVVRALAGGNPSSDFPIKIPEVILLLPTFTQKLVEQAYLQSKYIDTRWLTPFDNVAILTDDAKKLKYSVIPATYMDLPDYSGIYHVSPQLDQTMKFKMVKPSFMAMYSGLEAADLAGYVGYWIEGDRIYYTNQFTGVGGYKCETVLMKLVCSLDAYGDYDDIFISNQAQFDIIASFEAYYKSELLMPGDQVTDNRYLTKVNT